MVLFPSRAGSTWAAVGAIVFLVHCGTEGNDPAATGSPGPSSATATSAAPPSSSLDASTAPSPRSPHAGSWAGTFKAERGEVKVPEGVPYDSWKEDPGGAEGEGKVSLSVAPDGMVSGKVSGALGSLEVAGMLDEDGLRAGLTPADESGDMRGVITGELRDNGKLTASLRVSNATATLVRKASFELVKD